MQQCDFIAAQSFQSCLPSSVGYRLSTLPVSLQSAERTASQVVHTLLKLLCARSTALALQAPRKINSAFHPSPLSSNNGRSASSGYREQHSNAQYPKRFLGLQEAFAVYDKMLHLGVEPDVVTMNLVIKAAGAAGRMDAVEQLYDQMTSMGPTPTSITFVHLFAAFQNSLKKDYAWLSQVCLLHFSIVLSSRPNLVSAAASLIVLHQNFDIFLKLES